MVPVREVAQGVLCLPLRTPTLPPATTTNTLIVGRRRLAIVEPGTPYDDERRVLDRNLAGLARRGCEVVAILVTHHHHDHVGYAAGLRERLDAPLYAHVETAKRMAVEVDAHLEDGDVVELDDHLALEAVHTPGHAPGHLVYLERRSKIAYAGDMLAGTGWIMIDPDDGGDMSAYIDSLERLHGLASEVVPAHGPVIHEPDARLCAYIEHRLDRERKVVLAIEHGATTTRQVLTGAYTDTPRWLWPLAERSLEAHLRKLEADGKVERQGDRIAPKE